MSETMDSSVVGVPAIETEGPETGVPLGFRQLMDTTVKPSKLYVIYLTILIANPVTAGIYYFWGKTLLRRYLWSSVSIEGNPVEYTGYGSELFKGYLMALLLVFLPVFVASMVAAAVFENDPQVAQIVTLMIYGTLFLLLPVAAFKARRYILSRTVWRGIRMGQSGDAGTYALKYYKYTLIYLLSAGLAGPLKTIRLFEYRLCNTWFGSMRLHFSGNPGVLMKDYLMAYALSGVIIVGLVLLALPFVDQIQFMGEDDILISLVFFVLVGLPLLSAILSIPWIFYSAKLYRHIADNTTLGPWAFATDISGRALFGLIFGNAMIMVFTLGIGYPVVVARNLRFAVSRLSIAGPAQYDKVLQSSQDSPSVGEGLAEGLDVGAFG